MDERDVIVRLQRGEIEGLAVLVRRYQDQALRAAYLVTQDIMLAQDVVQTAFVHAYERIATFDAARPFGPWFLRSVVRAAVTAARRAGRTASLDAPASVEAEAAWTDLLADPAPGPAVEAERAELRAAVAAALARLSPEQRAVIVLRYYLDYSEKEMAEALDRPPGTIKSRLYMARRRLAALLRSTATALNWEGKA